MSRVGFLVLYATGHLNPSIALGRALVQRGHEVVFFNVADVGATIRDAELQFVPFGEAEYPLGSLPGLLQKVGEHSGGEAFAFFLERMKVLVRCSFQELPTLLKEAQLDALVVDQLFPGGGTLAERAALPFVSLANAVLLNREENIPPPSTLLPYEDSPAARERNRIGWDRLLAAFAPLLHLVNEQRERWQLPVYRDWFEDSFSQVAQISQQPAAFDFPRRYRPSSLHFVGHLHDGELTRAVPFPWARLDGTKPLLYASLGTLQNRLEWIYRAIIEACAELPVQVVLALGSTGLQPEQFEPIPANILILPYVPQAEVLGRATVCITHAGLNTALECLEAGVPTVCLPITSEQPGVAMRMQFLGAGKVVTLAELSAQTLRAAVQEVLQNPSYREAARRFAAAQVGADPRAAACDAIAEVLAKVPIQTKVNSGMG